MVAEFLDTPHIDKWVLCINTFYLESDANRTEQKFTGASIWAVHSGQFILLWIFLLGN